MKAGRRQRTLPKRWLRLGIAALSVIGVIGGCTTESRHKILTVVFTGVPEPGAAPAEPTDTATTSNATRRRTASLTPTFWVHGPFGARQCQSCHNLSDSTSFSAEPAAQDPTISSTAAFGSRLALPKEKLCVSCHISHSAESAASRSLQVHQPLRDGNCTACHNPHQMKRQYMLLGADNRELCARCHAPAVDARVAEHSSVSNVDCMQCHNAHIGTTAALLKKNDDELALLYAHEHDD
jgi:predicted CXXCH cytochrome family protein